MGAGLKAVYPTKRDLWLVILLWIAVGAMLLAAGKSWLTPASLASRVGMSIILISATAFVLWVLYATHYTLTDRDLLVRSGPFQWTVPLDAITEIFPTHNALSSPACSLDRLYIRYLRPGDLRSGVMISPQDKVAFLVDLVARAPGLKLEGQRVSRKQE